MRKFGRPCYSNRKIWRIERRSYNNIPLVSTYCEKRRHCTVICIRLFCCPKIRTTMSHSYSLQRLRLEDVVRLHKILKMERDGTIDFEDLQWTPPSSPKHEEGVKLLLPSLGRAELIIDQVFSHILSTLKIKFPRVKLWKYGVSEGSGEIPDILAEILQSMNGVNTFENCCQVSQKSNISVQVPKARNTMVRSPRKTWQKLALTGFSYRCINKSCGQNTVLTVGARRQSWGYN